MSILSELRSALGPALGTVLAELSATVHVRSRVETRTGGALSVAGCWPACRGDEVPDGLLADARERCDAFGRALDGDQPTRAALAAGNSQADDRDCGRDSVGGVRFLWSSRVIILCA